MGSLRLLLAAFMVATGTVALAGGASAAPGDFVSTVTFSQDCGSGIGVGIAYDGGGHLWVSCYGSNPDLLRADATTGVVDQTYNIEGGLGALAYDATRNALWAGPGCGSSGDVWLIQLDGTKSVTGSAPKFTPGLGGCLDDGIAYDATDDTLYYSPDGSTQIEHDNTNGTTASPTFTWTGTGCYNSGLAIGGSLLFEGSDGCGHVWVVDKTTLAATFDFSTVIAGDANFRDEGLSCDTDTFKSLGKQVMWSKEAYTPNRAAAFEIPPGTCGVGGQPPPGLTLTPATDSNPVGTDHTVTATLKDSSDNPVSGAAILFSVTGPDAGASGTCSPVTCWTDANGQVTFTYTNNGTTGTDTITACYDKDSSNTCDAGEATATATKHWTLATGTITVHKTVDAGGESPTSFCFTLSPDPGNGQVCADSSGDAVFNNVPVGTYGANETTSSDFYYQVSNDCTGLVIASQGDTQTCDVHDTFILLHLSAGTTRCNGFYAGTGKRVVVLSGAECTLVPGTRVKRSVTVKTGGTLHIDGVKIGGLFNIAGSATVCGSRLGRGVTATGGSLALGGPGCAGNKIIGRVLVQYDANNVTVWGNKILGSLTVKYGTGATDSIVSNIVLYALLVAYNGPPVEVSHNSAGVARCVSNTGQTGSGNVAHGIGTGPPTNTCPR